MKHTISATDARVHFGEVMRQAQNAPVVVERGGQPVVVILSKQEYDRLTTEKATDWQELMIATRKKLAIELQGKEITPPEEIIRRAREARSEQLLDNLR